MRVFVLGEGGKVNTTFRCGISRPTVPGLPLPEPYCVRLTCTGYAQVRHCLKWPCLTHVGFGAGWVFLDQRLRRASQTFTCKASRYTDSHLEEYRASEPPTQATLARTGVRCSFIFNKYERDVQPVSGRSLSFIHFTLISSSGLLFIYEPHKYL